MEASQAEVVEQPIPDLIDALDQSTSQFGAFHPQTISVVNRLAVALWKVGDARQAVSLLNEALDGISSSCAPEHPVRRLLLSTLGEILIEEARWEQAASVYREVLECCVRQSGLNDASSLAAKGDLAVVLFELGQATEAAELEWDAFERAGRHLGKTHPVTCVLAWNRALRLENHGEADSARTILVNDLLWLLARDEAALHPDQMAVRAMLAKRWNWDTAQVC